MNPIEKGKTVRIPTIDTIEKQELLINLLHKKGYYLAEIALSELNVIRELIEEQYLHCIQMVNPAVVGEYKAKAMREYHNIYTTEHFEHGKLWTKTARVLGPKAFGEIQSLDFWQSLRELFGDFFVSDEERFGWQNVYWRLVRPGASDVGSVHADKWFWDLGHGHMPDGYERVKLWLAVDAQPHMSGLRVVPYSQKSTSWRYHAEERAGLKKPVIDEPEDELELVNLPLSPGQCVLFHDQLLHGGMPNSSQTTRVSLEFTLLVPRENYLLI